MISSFLHRRSSLVQCQRWWFHSSKPSYSCFSTTSRTLCSAVPQLSPENDLTENHRPRLQALRQTLRQEEPTLQKFESTPTTTSSSAPSPTTTKKEEPDVFEILKQLRKQHPLGLLDTHMLTDSYKRHHTYLRLSLTERCNLRCRYCMPPEGVPLQPSESLLSNEEVLHLTKLFCAQGVDKVRLTGGEPLLRKDLVSLVESLSEIKGLKQIGMTTNGITLGRQLEDLVDAGLTHVNISLDTLSEQKFLDLTRRPGLHKVLQSLDAASQTLRKGRVKLNCVVMRDVNDDELEDFCLLTQQYPVDVRFIEWMPFSQNGWNQNRFVAYQEMLQRLSPLQLERVQDGPNDTTKWYKLPSDSSMGRIGFITSMSQHFCGTCNRLRLTADGQIKVCLFGASELSLRDVLRSTTTSKEDLQLLIYHALQQKKYALGGHGSAQGIADAGDNRPMTLIGG